MDGRKMIFICSACTLFSLCGDCVRLNDRGREDRNHVVTLEWEERQRKK